MSTYKEAITAVENGHKRNAFRLSWPKYSLVKKASFSNALVNESEEDYVPSEADKIATDWKTSDNDPIAR
jgi:hypothetical protein